jgi:hypothetical protein
MFSKKKDESASGTTRLKVGTGIGTGHAVTSGYEGVGTLCRAPEIWQKRRLGVTRSDKAKARLHKYIVYDFNTGKEPPTPQVR